MTNIETTEKQIIIILLLTSLFLGGFSFFTSSIEERNVRVMVDTCKEKGGEKILWVEVLQNCIQDGKRIKCWYLSCIETLAEATPNEK